MSTTPHSYRYSGKATRASELAKRMVEIGTAKLQLEGMAEAEALNVMRAIVSEVCDEWGGTTLSMPKEVAWDGLTARDREIWNAFTGTNIDELVKRFRLCDRQLRYVLGYCRRYFGRLHQPDLPGLEPTEPATEEGATP